MTYPDGTRYVGQFLYGRRHGTGRLTRAPGEVEEGEWKAGVLSGKCRIEKDEVVYDGQCLDGNASGAGRLDDKPKNLVYEGEFLKDQFEGKGSLHAGDVAYEGMFKAGLMDGPGSLKVGKVTMRGDFKRGLMLRGTINADDGRTYEVDVEKQEVLEVAKDGTKRSVERLPPDITI